MTVLHLDVLGRRLALTVPPDADAVIVRRLMVRFPCHPMDDRIAAGARAAIAEQTLGATVGALNQLAVTGRTFLAVHAGVVAHGDRVVAFTASSGAGKSTLTAACVRRGWAYASDEALCLDRATGDLIPYPKPLSLSPWSAAAVGLPPGVGVEVTGELLVTPDELGAPPSPLPRRLTDVVLPERGHADAALEALPRMEAVRALLKHSFNHFHDVDGTVALLSQLAPDLRVWRLRYGDPLVAAERLADLPEARLS